jgi:hypothetical protein
MLQPDDECWQGQERFLFLKTSILALRPAQLDIRLVPIFLSQGVKWLGHEGNHSPPCGAEVQNEWRYTFATLCSFVAETRTLPLLYLLYLATWNGVLLEKLMVPQLVKKFPAYLNLKVHHHAHKILPLVLRQINSVSPATLPPQSYIFNLHFNIVLPSMLWSSKWLVPLRFANQNPVCISVHMSLGCHAVTLHSTQVVPRRNFPCYYTPFQNADVNLISFTSCCLHGTGLCFHHVIIVECRMLKGMALGWLSVVYHLHTFPGNW